MPSKHKNRHKKSSKTCASSSSTGPQTKTKGPADPGLKSPDLGLKSEPEVNEISKQQQSDSIPSLPHIVPPPPISGELPKSSFSSDKLTQTETMAPRPGDSTAPGIVSEPPVLIAVKALLQVIEEYNGSTVNGLFSELKAAKGKYTENPTEDFPTKSRLAVESACTQLIQYATLTLASVETEDLSKCREQMLSEGLKYLKRCKTSVDKITKWAVTLIFDGARILVHSDSLVVLETLRSVPKNIYFSVYIVIDDDSVSKFFEDNYNIDVKTIRDAEIGTLMDGMDLVMVGAEAVLKNGGIINKVGTLPLAICAKEMNKPMYVLAESFKFSRMYPMSQSDLPKNIRENAVTKRIRVDYTLPKYITFLVTDRGLLTPTAVCDELIELYT